MDNKSLKVIILSLLFIISLFKLFKKYYKPIRGFILKSGFLTTFRMASPASIPNYLN